MIKVKSGECHEVIDDPAITFEYAPDHFQLHSFIAINNNENVLVTAHTGSGKTAIAKYAIAHTLRNGKKVIYTSPIKTLSNQKFAEFTLDFAENSVGLMTGDNKIDPNAEIVIMTTEILRNALYDDGRELVKDDYFSNDFISNLGCVIFDEVHYINDPDRGSVWEETINLLPNNVILVMLSATINNPEKFASWIANIKNKIVTIVPTSHRVVPLEHYIYTGEDCIKIMDSSNTFDFANYNMSLQLSDSRNYSNKHLMNKMVQYLQDNDMFQTIVFAFSRKKCEEFARSVNINIITHEERAEIEKIFNKYMLKYKNDYEHLNQYSEVLLLMQKGICYHHSGLLPILKEIIEIIFEKGLVKILFATETFAVGVNMPTRSVVFTSLEKFTDGQMRSLFCSEYKQMAGRAGRRGIDINGYVYILPLYELVDINTMNHMLTGNPPELCSQFSLNYSFLLKIFISKNIGSIDEFVSNSLYQIDNSSSTNQLVNDIKEIEAKLDSFPKISDDHLLIILELNELDNKENEFAQSGLNVKMSKSDIKKKKKLMSKIRNDPELQIVYDNYTEFMKLQNELNVLKNDMQSNMEYINEYSQLLFDVLIHFNYIHSDAQLNTMNDNDVTIKGIIASQINECNNLLLTEMLVTNIFDDLNVPEIVGLLAIFINDNKEYEYDNNFSTNMLYTAINKVTNIINDYQIYEENKGIHNYEFWEISYEFVNISHMWASGCTVHELFTTYDIYEGNFIRAMLKLNNILNDLINLSKILNHLESIPKYELAQERILRDIVSVNSLYLS
jgi:superfamily II RNA helicase